MYVLIFLLLSLLHFLRWMCFTGLNLVFARYDNIHIYECKYPSNLALLSTAVMPIPIYIFFILLCCSYFVFHYSNSSFSFFHTLFFVCIFILSCIEDTQQRSWSHCLSLVTVLHMFFQLRCSPSLFDYLVP